MSLSERERGEGFPEEAGTTHQSASTGERDEGFSERNPATKASQTPVTIRILKRLPTTESNQSSIRKLSVVTAATCLFAEVDFERVADVLVERLQAAFE